ncbi:sulfite oxidase-like protein [Microthyrium microscopicum]|uniref:Sulfite oxidase-like protein n=1 Tax=Microthyrium microscopicum TaxID=703497 RepID=A0A6A6U385_9PEZI|nr:sulfite oxidase-like protein [Microthyrium microscopicum]
MAKDYEYTGEEPENREPNIAELLDSYITPVSTAYDRNHSEYPEHIDPNTHTFAITGLVQKPLSLHIADLRALPQHSVLCCLQCAGNRRHTMRTKIKEVNGIDWFDGAIANCVWRGPRLCDVLSLAGLDDSVRGEKGWVGHVEFVCDGMKCQDAANYGGSVALERAMCEDADVILALEMNGAPLTIKHGAPVRAVVPGVLGARSVKWLDRITVQMHESRHFYQQRDYKMLPPEAVDAKEAEKFWDSTPPMNDMPVNSVVGIPRQGTTVRRDENGMIDVRGYAVPAGMDGPVVKVEVSGDDGRTWTEAVLDFGGNDCSILDSEDGRKSVRWAWCLWRTKVRVAKGSGRVLSRATDFKGNLQPREGQWTLRGVGYNAWGESADLTVI